MMTIWLRLRSGPGTVSRVESRETTDPPRLVLSETLPSSAVGPQAAGLGVPILVIGPNPSTGTSVIRVLVSQRTDFLALGIYDAGGRLVRGLYRGPASSNQVELRWDGRDSSDRPAPDGIYFVRANVGAAGGMGFHGGAEKLLLLRK